MENIPAIRFENITKAFGSKVIANKHVTMDIEQGEIMALLGENGSGKTTLMNMLSGIYRQDEGIIYINGEEAHINSPKDAYALGIGMIHQHFKLVDVFTAIENIALGMDSNLTGSNREIAAKVKEICDKYGFDVDPRKKVYNMTVSEKQTLEIVKTLYRGANILILDEPTAVLTPQETDKLFAVMRNMKADGKSIIIITHKLNEVLAISDRVAILRKGEYIGTVLTAEASVQSLTDMMVGEKVELDIERPEIEHKEKRLSVRHLSCRDKYGVTVLDDVSFDAYSGEILGVAGISGSGQKQLLEAIAGLQETEEGSSIKYHIPGSVPEQEEEGKEKPETAEPANKKRPETSPAKRAGRIKLISILEIFSGSLPLIIFGILGLTSKRLRAATSALVFTTMQLVGDLSFIFLYAWSGAFRFEPLWDDRFSTIITCLFIYTIADLFLNVLLLVLIGTELYDCKGNRKDRFRDVHGATPAAVLEICTFSLPIMIFGIISVAQKRLRGAVWSVIFVSVQLTGAIYSLVFLNKFTSLLNALGFQENGLNVFIINVIIYSIVTLIIDLILLYYLSRVIADWNRPEDEPGKKELVGKSVNEIKKLGVSLAFVPEDRLGMGLVGSMGMSDNMMLRSYKKGFSIFTDRKTPRNLAIKVKDELEVVTPGITTPVRKLSGGNVQKVLVGREIALEPTVMMAAYAVRGLDINTSYTIYHLLNDQKKKGTAVIYVGEDLDVLLALCDRIMVLCDGKLNGIVDGRTVTKETVGMMMTHLNEGLPSDIPQEAVHDIPAAATEEKQEGGEL